MRFILGLIVGILLTIGGAFIHDSLEAGDAAKLVNWTNVSALQHAAFESLKTQFDRVVKWVTSS